MGELVRLNIEDIDFSERECVVYGKGDKERKAYFDAKTKIHFLNYIDESRTDDNSALFVSLNERWNLKIHFTNKESLYVGWKQANRNTCDACVLCLKWNRITIYAKRIV